MRDRPPSRRPLSAVLAALLIGAAPLAPFAHAAADPADRSNSPPNVIDGSALVRALRAGGHVIYFRHGKTDLGTQDTDRRDLANCRSQRQLSAEGRAEMESIGRSFRALAIPVGTVLSSPYCRAIDTVRLAFGRAAVDADLKHTITADEATTKRQAQALRRLLAAPPASGTNTVLAGHTGNLQEATGIWPSPEGVAIVFKPDGRGGFDYVATVAPARWAEWQRSAAAAKRPRK